MKFFEGFFLNTINPKIGHKWMDVLLFSLPVLGIIALFTVQSLLYRHIIITIVLVFLLILNIIRIITANKAHPALSCNDYLDTAFKGYEELSDFIRRQRDYIHQLSLNNSDEEIAEIFRWLDTRSHDLETRIVQIKQWATQNPDKLDSARVQERLSTELALNINQTSSQIFEINREFYTNYFKIRDQNAALSINMARNLYYLGNLIPIISDLSTSSNKFSHDIIVDVVGHFENIADFSTRITQDIQQSMSALMDDSRQDSLSYILKQAHAVVQDFEQFFQSMESLRGVSDSFVTTTIQKLSHIADIALSIEDISETIKVLSLNVSIEAANTGTSARGFQVLARDLREFAQKTLKFAGEVKSQVNETIETTGNIKDRYLQNMQVVYDYVIGLKASIESFEVIIQNSFQYIEDIIHTLNDFSNNLNKSVKQIIGKLQYQDITNQEVEHISLLISRILELSTKGVKETHASDYLDTETRLVIRKEILDIINELITTSNERKILQEYEAIFDINVEDNGILDFSSGQTISEQGEFIIF